MAALRLVCASANPDKVMEIAAILDGVVDLLPRPPGVPEPRQGIQIQVLRKTAGRWLITAFQNTNAVPETPFPLGPPAGSPAGSPAPPPKP